MVIKLSGGKVYDPVNNTAGEVKDIYLRDGHIIAEPGPGTRIEQDYDVSGKIVMAGAIDIHSHIAGGNVNNARLLLPEQHRAFMAGRLQYPFASAKWSTFETGYRYAQMGFTTVVEPAVLPVNALHAHLELADIPIIDKAGLAVLGNDDYLLRMLRAGKTQDQINDYVAWTLAATQCLGLKVINAGGANAFKFNTRTLDLDDEVPYYGVSSRTILQTLQRAVHQLKVPHPLHVHCNNLGVAGNVNTALATIDAAEGLPMHLAHIQFYGYGAEGERGFSSGAAQLAEAINSHPNITADVGQILFGQTVTISGDSMRQFAARKLSRPRKWVSWDAECEGGGGIVPYQYKAKNFVNTLQWAIGLEIFLLVDDPWRMFFTTDHPNGAPFTRYPQLFRLLMDKDYRSAWLEQVNGKALELALLPQLEREYSLYEIAIMTRAAPARLLGLSDRGQLGAGAIADIAVYSEQSNVEAMFAAADLVFKNGELVVRDGQVVASPKGAIHTIRPAFDHAVERSLQGYFDQFYTLKLDNFKVHDSVFQQQGSALVAHSC
jgi:formylmethanofuran dehydrogenase subunit A